MFRLTLRSTIELVLTLIFGLAGALMLRGTMDEYKAGRAFNKAMDHYAARDLEPLHDELNRAIEAKPSYLAPQEAMGKLTIDDGRRAPAKFDEARKIFKALYEAEKRRARHPTLPVLIGLAVAELEAAKANSPAGADLGPAIEDAVQRLQEAEELYPNSGDLHISLAAVALRQDDLRACSTHLDRVSEVGNISIDALPFLYNLKGLLAFRSGKFDEAVGHLENVREFAPERVKGLAPAGEIARLNLAAAYAKSLIHGTLEPSKAASNASKIAHILDRIDSTDHPLYPPIVHSLAIYHIRQGDYKRSLQFFGQPEGAVKLQWHGQFNLAIARYLGARDRRPEDPERARILRQVRTDLGKLLGSRSFRELPARHRTRRVAPFVAACILGTIAAELKDPEAAVADFLRALEAAKAVTDKNLQAFRREALLRVHRSLAALYLASGRYKEGLDHLTQSMGLVQKDEPADRLLRRLSTPPQVRELDAKQDKLLTDHDLRFTAFVEAQATPEPVTNENIRLTLTNTLTGVQYAFGDLRAPADGPRPRGVTQLDGTKLHGVMLDLPQGKFELALQVVDNLGNKSNTARTAFAIDREPPRVLDRQPAPGATTKALDLIQCRLDDLVGEVNLATLKVDLTYPRGSATANHTLVSGGKYRFASADGAIQKDTPATTDVRCPVPPGAANGVHTVHVTVQDTAGKTCSAGWSFTLAP